MRMNWLSHRIIVGLWLPERTKWLSWILTNVGLRFADNKSTLVFEDSFITSEEKRSRRLDVV